LAELKAQVGPAPRTCLQVTEDTYGFAWGPRLNAPGRMANANIALRLLLASGAIEAKKYVEECMTFNAWRKATERAILAEAEPLAEAEIVKSNPCVLILCSPAWHPGVVGIVASRIKELHGRPVIVASMHPDPEAAARISSKDIADMAGLLHRLIRHTDPVSASLWKKLSDAEQEILLNCQPMARNAALRQAAVGILNRLIGGRCLHQRNAFKGILVRPETKCLLKLHPKGIPLARLNRLLLEDCFPLALLRNRKGFWKGSGRSVDGVEMGTLFQQAKKLGAILEGGGHSKAGGLSFSEKQKANLAAELEKISWKFSVDDIKDLPALINRLRNESDLSLIRN
jgi:single-stranded DNA-specific DHH superfamily exonuclease